MPGTRTGYDWPKTGGLIVVDLEYTAWEGSLERGWSRPGELREVVQIGAVRLDAGAGFAETAAFEALVQPRVNPALSPYFTQLTGITDARLNAHGIDLAPALDAFARFAGCDVPLVANGDDGAVIADNCRLVGIADPLPPARWRDVSGELAALCGGDVSSYRIPALLGLAETSGRAHDALADARAIAAGLRHGRALGLI